MSTQFTNDQWRLPNAWNGSESNVNKQSNYSISFDGNNQYIDLGNSTQVQPVKEMSISAWINASSLATYRGIVSCMYNGSSYDGFALRLDDTSSNKIQFVVNSSTQIKSTSTITTGQWYHLVATYDGANIKLYFNGSLESTTSLTGNIDYTDGSRNTIIGSLYPNVLEFTGKIDGVSIYNYALSSSQVTTLYGSSSTGIGNPMSLSPKPVAYYPLGDQDAFNGSSYLTPNASLKDFVFKIQSGDKIDTGIINLGYQFTVSFWFQRTVTGEYRLLNITNSAGDSNTRYLVDIVYSASNQVFSHITDTSGFQSIVDSNIPLNSWIHCAYTRNGRDSNIYLSYNGGFNKNSGANSMQFPVGQETTNTYIVDLIQSIPGDGFLSNVNYFTSILTLSEIETLYNNGSPLTSMSGFTSLQAWWKLDASATYDGTDWTIPDDSTNSNTGTSSGMTQANLVQSDLSFKTSYSPYALEFDGTNDYISIPNSTDFNLGTSFTISGWFNVTSYVSNMGYISFDSSTRGWFLFHQNTNLALYDGTSVATLNSNLQPTNEWNSYIITYDGTDLIFYLNGQQNSTQSVSINLQTNGNDGQIGNQQFAAGRFYNGSISNLSIWNTALSSSQVTEIYNEGVPSNLNNHSAYSNLVSWWQLGSNSSFNTNWTVLDEVAASGNNGTSVNMDEVDIVDGVGSYANGLSSGMGGDEIVGNAFGSSANSLSINMDVLDRTEDTPA